MNKIELTKTANGAHLETETKSGLTVLDVEHHSNGNSFSTTIRGKFTGEDIFESISSVDGGNIVVVYTRENERLNTFTFSTTNDKLIGQISIINGSNGPAFFKVDLKRLNASNNFSFENLVKSILDNKETEFIASFKADRVYEERTNEVHAALLKDPNFESVVAPMNPAPPPANPNIIRWYCWAILIPIYSGLVLFSRRCRTFS